MSPGIRALTVLGSVLWLSAFAHEAKAQETPIRVMPPRLLSMPERAWSGPETSVELVLTITSEGRVSEVQVPEGVDALVAEHCRAVLRETNFEPARRGDDAIAVRVPFRFHLRATPERDSADARGEGADAARDDVDDVVPNDMDAGADERGGDDAGADEREDDASAIERGESDSAEEREDDAGADEREDDAEDDLALEERDDERLIAYARVLRPIDQRSRSSEAVDAISLDDAHREASDLGEVLARRRGVSVQQSGGLGSASRVSLAGFGGASSSTACLCISMASSPASPTSRPTWSNARRSIAASCLCDTAPTRWAAPSI